MQRTIHVGILSLLVKNKKRKNKTAQTLTFGSAPFSSNNFTIPVRSNAAAKNKAVFLCAFSASGEAPCLSNNSTALQQTLHNNTHKDAQDITFDFSILAKKQLQTLFGGIRQKKKKKKTIKKNPYIIRVFPKGPIGRSRAASPRDTNTPNKSASLFCKAIQREPIPNYRKKKKKKHTKTHKMKQNGTWFVELGSAPAATRDDTSEEAKTQQE